MSIFLSNASNEEYIKHNNINFRRERKEKSQKAHSNQRMRGIINCMAIEGGTDVKMNPIVNFSRAFEDDTESNQDFSDDESYE